MSGGHYDYFTFKLEDFANSIERQDSDPKRRAFADALRLAAAAAYAIEWVDSGDIAPGEDDKAIDTFLNLFANVDIQVKVKAYDLIKNIMEAK